MSSFTKTMQRENIIADINRLVAVSELSHHKREWVKFAFLRDKEPSFRLTLDEWIYLAVNSGYTKLWAHSEYNRQEGYAWHRLRLEPIEKEIANENL